MTSETQCGDEVEADERIESWVDEHPFLSATLLPLVMAMFVVLALQAAVLLVWLIFDVGTSASALLLFLFFLIMLGMWASARNWVEAEVQLWRPLLIPALVMAALVLTWWTQDTLFDGIPFTVLFVLVAAVAIARLCMHGVGFARRLYARRTRGMMLEATPVVTTLIWLNVWIAMGRDALQILRAAV